MHALPFAFRIYYLLNVFFPSNAFMAFVRSLHTFNRSKKMNCKLSCKAVYPSIASKALVMDQSPVSNPIKHKTSQKRQTNKQNTPEHNNTKNETRHREVGSLPALRNEMDDDILCVIMSMAGKRSKTKTTRKNTRGPYKRVKKQQSSMRKPGIPREQPFRHNIHPGTSKQRTTTPCRNESGEKRKKVRQEVRHDLLRGDTWRFWISMSFWNQFLGASECIVLGFFKHILCPSGAIHHWSVMACDCKCGQVLQAELAELKQRRQELREVGCCFFPLRKCIFSVAATFWVAKLDFLCC